MTRQFIHDATAARVIFVAGASDDIGPELERLGANPLLVCDGQAGGPVAKLNERLAGQAVAVIDQVRQHVPIEDVVAARGVARDRGADCIVAVGGGSTIGIAKAIALESGLKILAIPTTYAGSEMTPVWGITENGVKTTGRAAVVAPTTVVYDPPLTYSLPPAITAASGLNAIAHCVDALWRPDAVR